MLSLPNVAANIPVVFLKLKTGHGTPLLDFLAMPHYTLWKPKSPNYPRPWIIQPLSAPQPPLPWPWPHSFHTSCLASVVCLNIMFPAENTNCCLLLVTSSPDVTLTSRYLPDWSPNWKLQHLSRPYPPFFVLFPPMTPNSITILHNLFIMLISSFLSSPLLNIAPYTLGFSWFCLLACAKLWLNICWLNEKLQLFDLRWR